MTELIPAGTGTTGAVRPIPYAEATGSQTLANNTFAAADLTTSVYDNGAITCGSALVDLAGNVINLKRPGYWRVTAAVNWPNYAGGYRKIDIGLNFFGGTHGGDLNSVAFNDAYLQSTEALLTVADNTGYGVYLSMYQNSGPGLAITTRLRAAWVGPYNV